MIKLHQFNIKHKCQKGNTLIVCLVFLLLLSIIGVGAMRSATLQERMAGNVRDTHIALQAAEAALREAEAYLLANYSSAVFDGTNGLYDCQSSCSSPSLSWADKSTISSTTWKAISTGAALSSVGQQPQYVIEKLTQQANAGGSLKSSGGSKVLLYRITARGFGIGADTSTSSMVVLQSYYRIDQ